MNGGCSWCQMAWSDRSQRRCCPAQLRRTEFPLMRCSPPIAPHVGVPALVTCLRRSWVTGISVSPRCVCLAFTPVQRHLGCMSRHRNSFRLRHTGPWNRVAFGENPTATTCRHHARRLGGLRVHRRLRLAEVHARRQGCHAVRYKIRGRGGSLVRGESPVGTVALGKAGCRICKRLRSSLGRWIWKILTQSPGSKVLPRISGSQPTQLVETTNPRPS